MITKKTLIKNKVFLFKYVFVFDCLYIMHLYKTRSKNALADYQYY